MAAWTEVTSVIASGTYTMPYDGQVLVGAKSGTVTVSITINGTSYNYPETIEGGNCKGLSWRIPAQSVLTFLGSGVDLVAYA